MISITLLFSLDSSAICELNDVPGNRNDWIVLQEIHLGCWTDFVDQDGAEVHILSLLSSNVSLLWDHCVFHGSSTNQQRSVVQCCAGSDWFGVGRTDNLVTL